MLNPTPNSEPKPTSIQTLSVVEDRVGVGEVRGSGLGMRVTVMGSGLGLQLWGQG